jgi:hypothetical protein
MIVVALTLPLKRRGWTLIEEPQTRVRVLKDSHVQVDFSRDGLDKQTRETRGSHAANVVNHRTVPQVQVGLVLALCSSSPLFKTVIRLSRC